LKNHITTDKNKINIPSTQLAQNKCSALSEFIYGNNASHSDGQSGICLRLIEGADIYQVAKNCRTSVEMIEKHYAAHIKDTIDTAAVNVRKKRA
jgi:hypothetical protein